MPEATLLAFKEAAATQAPQGVIIQGAQALLLDAVTQGTLGRVTLIVAVVLLGPFLLHLPGLLENSGIIALLMNTVVHDEPAFYL